MRVITSPENFDSITENDKVLFLAGGISNCPDWQTDIIGIFEYLVDEDFVIINPRRDDGIDFDDEVASTTQILWEIQGLQLASHILFWFPKETVCPITLFELGKQLVIKNQNRDVFQPFPIAIGMHLQYSRRLDVLVQSKAIYRDMVFHDSLFQLADDVVKIMRLKRGI